MSKNLIQVKSVLHADMQGMETRMWVTLLIFSQCKLENIDVDLEGKMFFIITLIVGVKNPVYQHSLKMAGRGRGMPKKWIMFGLSVVH